MATPFISEIKMAACNFAPVNYALCNGQLLAIAQNTALFSLLGTTYGGNGTTSFALPNMQGRVPVHVGGGPGLTTRVLGEVSGTETVTLLSINLPAHSHTVALPASTLPGNAASPSGNKLATSSLRGDNQYTSVATDTTLASATSSITGSNAAFGVMQPFIAVNFIIATQGIFPSRI